MTIEEVKKAAEVMIAFAEGAEIQYSHKGQNNWINWINKFPPSFDLQAFDYRIKPKSKYRPFKNQEECWNEMHKRPDFGWVKYKDSKSMYHIRVIAHNYILIDDADLSFFEAFDRCEFFDGTPYGHKY